MKLILQFAYKYTDFCQICILFEEKVLICMSNRILLVDDEEKLLNHLFEALSAKGYEVVTAKNGLAALKLYEEQRFDLVILDIMMPEIDGHQVCEKIRLENPEQKILFLTAKDSTRDKIEGLRLGAKDYVTKPYNSEELLLRIGNLATPSPTDQGAAATAILNTYSFGGNTINFKTYQASCNMGTIDLTQKEVMLLKLFIERKNQVISRTQILQTVWGYDVYPVTRTIDNFILNFRKYFEPNPAEPIYFYSIQIGRAHV